MKKTHKEYYQANKEHYAKRIGAWNKARRNELRALAIEYLANHPCSICGESDIVVLDFHHVRGTKNDTVGRLILKAVATKTLMKEIDKCDVLCANCHRRETAKSGNWFKNL